MRISAFGPVLVLGLAVLLSGCLITAKGTVGASDSGRTGADSGASSSGSSAIVEYTFNFSSPSGYQRSDGSAALVGFKAQGLSSGEKAQCRVGLQRLISSRPWQDCSNGLNVSVLSSAPSNHHSGTFVAQAQVVLGNGSVVGSKEQSFYIHPSLNKITECTPKLTDQEVFSLAGPLLSQGSVFPEGSALEGPQYKLALANGRGFDFVSFRKKLVMNDSKTMVILKRRYKASSMQNCDLRVGEISRKDLDWVNLEAKGSVFYHHHWSLNYSQGNVSKDPTSDKQSFGQDPVLGKRVDQFAKHRNAFVKSLKWRRFHRGLSECSALVANALGSVVCIDAASQKPYSMLGAMDKFRNGHHAQKQWVADSDEALSAGADLNLRKEIAPSIYSYFYED